MQTSQAVARPRNIADTEVYGLEASASFGWTSGFTLEASGTLQHSEETSGFAAGNPLPYQPARIGYLGAAYDNRSFLVRYEITYVGENSIDRLDTPILRLQSRVVHDAQLGYRRPEWAMELSIELRNVLDREVRDVSRYPLPGRAQRTSQPPS